MHDALRLEVSADLPVAPADLYAISADLRNLPAWWIEHLSAEVEAPAVRLRDAVYRVRYRLRGGLVITGTCTVVAARSQRTLTYVWQGAGVRMAIGQTFLPAEGGCRAVLCAEMIVGMRIAPLGLVVSRLLRSTLTDEMERALETLGELAAARSVLRRSADRPPAPRPTTWERAPVVPAARRGEAAI